MNLKKYTPEKLYETDDTDKYIQIFEYVGSLIEIDIQNFPNIKNVDLCDDKYLDYLLYDLGWDLAIELSNNDKRKIIKLAIIIYKNKGVREGIESVIQTILGIDCEIYDISGTGLFWRLGISRLGVNTILGPTGYMWWFRVEFFQPLTAYQENIVRKIVDYMSPPWTMYQIKQP